MPRGRDDMTVLVGTGAMGVATIVQEQAVRAR